MKITNKYGLPSGFYNVANDQRGFKDKKYSVTTILNSTRQILLTKRNFDTLEQDCSDMLNLVFGTAIHHVLEMADKENVVEQRLKIEVQDGYFLTGQFDLYNKETFTIEDYKSTTVYKVKSQDFDDWKKQGLMYAWLAMKNGIHVEHLKFHALLKDWKASEAKRKGKDYPPRQVYTWEYDILTSDLIEIEEFIRARFKEIIYYEDKELLPMCTEIERWATPTKYAVMKKGRKSALKIFDTLADAEAHPVGDFIQTRIGEDKKCDNYCVCCTKCDYWRSKNE